MKDRGKTREQLLKEVAELRHQVAELKEPEVTHQHIADDKRAQQKLKESEQRFSSIFHGAGDGLIFLSKSGKILDVNDKAVAIYGGTREMLLGKHFTKIGIFSPKIIPEMLLAFKAVLAGRRPQITFTLHNKLGEKKELECSAEIVREEKKIPGLTIVARDITERKQMEEALRESEERYRSLVEAGECIGEAIIMVQDTETTRAAHVFASPEWSRITGYTAEELKEISYYDLVHPRYHDEVADRVRRRLQGENIPGMYELSIVTRDGREVPLEAAACSTISYKGKPADVGYMRDITERKQREEDLKESEERYRALVDLGAETGEAVVMLQDDERGVGMHVFASEAWSRITGYSTEELLNISMADLIHPRDRAAAVGRHNRRMQGDELPGLYEISIIKKDGTEVPVEVTYAFSHFRGKRVNVGYIRDITRRKQAEEALQLRAHLLNHATDSIVAADLEGNIIYVNDTACRARGYTKEEMLEMNLRDTVTPQNAGLVSKRIKKIIEDGYMSFESEHVRRDGSTFPVEITSRTIKLGREDLIHSVIRDITERKKAETALKESEEFNSSVLHNSPNPILVANPDTSIRYVNPALEKLTGFSLDELIGQKLPRPWWPEDFLEKIGHDAKIAYRRGFKGLEHCFQKKSGERFWVQITATPVFIDGKFRQFIDNWVDITERKRMEEELVRSRDYLARLNNSMTDMVFDIKLPERTIQYINKAVETVLGYSPEECIGQSIAMIYPGQKVYREVGRRLWRGVERGDEITTSEHELRRKDGRIITVEGRTSLLMGDGEAVTALSVVRDITERKEAEEQLKSERDKLQAMMSGLARSGIGIDIISRDYRIRFLNEALQERFGNIVGKLCYENYMARKEPCEFCPMREAIRTNKIENVELTAADGRDFEILSAPLPNPDGTIDQAIEVVRDITERKKAEAALRESEEFNSSVLRNSPNPVLVANSDTSIRYVNPALEELAGFTLDELAGQKAPYPWWPEESISAIGFGLEEAMRSGIRRVERLFQKKNGRRFWVEVTATPIIIAGEQRHYIANWVDVTERKVAETEYQTIVRTTMDGFWLADMQGRFLDVNDAYCHLIGYSRDELLNMSISDVEAMEKPGETAERIRKIKKVGLNRFETRHRRKDGEIVDVEISVNYLPTEEGRMVVFIREITERKKMEEERQRSTKLESLGTLAGGIAHDFNNLLTGILGNVSLARRYVEPDSKAAERLGEAEKASIRARDLTQQLLTFSRGGAPIKKTAFIDQLLVDTTRFALRGSNIRPEFFLADDTRPVDIDEGQISQVLTNLIINACDAMPQGGKLQIGARNLSAKEVRSLKLTPGQHIEVTVSDPGAGIPPEHIGRVFEPYFTTKPKGSGLGLATVYSVIKNHEGHITIASEVGKGTTFHIYLPASKEPVATTAETPSDAPIVGRGKLLVMDDEDIIREFLRHELADVGYDVTTTSDGAEAIEQYEKAKNEGEPFDAVILDLTVSGGIGGKEAIKQLRKIDPRVKAIASSGYANDPIMANHRKYGFRAVVAKPYRVGELEKTLQDVLKPKL